MVKLRWVTDYCLRHRALRRLYCLGRLKHQCTSHRTLRRMIIRVVYTLVSCTSRSCLKTFVLSEACIVPLKPKSVIKCGTTVHTPSDIGTTRHICFRHRSHQTGLSVFGKTCLTGSRSYHEAGTHTKQILMHTIEKEYFYVQHLFTAKIYSYFTQILRDINQIKPFTTFCQNLHSK